MPIPLLSSSGEGFSQNPPPERGGNRKNNFRLINPCLSDWMINLIVFISSFIMAFISFLVGVRCLEQPFHHLSSSAAHSNPACFRAGTVGLVCGMCFCCLGLLSAMGRLFDERCLIFMNRLGRTISRMRNSEGGLRRSADRIVSWCRGNPRRGTTAAIICSLFLVAYGLISIVAGTICISLRENPSFTSRRNISQNSPYCLPISVLDLISSITLIILGVWGLLGFSNSPSSRDDHIC